MYCSGSSEAYTSAFQALKCFSRRHTQRAGLLTPVKYVIVMACSQHADLQVLTANIPRRPIVVTYSMLAELYSCQDGQLRFCWCCHAHSPARRSLGHLWVPKFYHGWCGTQVMLRRTPPPYHFVEGFEQYTTLPLCWLLIPAEPVAGLYHGGHASQPVQPQCFPAASVVPANCLPAAMYGSPGVTSGTLAGRPIQRQ